MIDITLSTNPLYYNALSLISVIPFLHSISPTGRISTGPYARYMESRSRYTVATMLWPLMSWIALVCLGLLQKHPDGFSAPK